MSDLKILKDINKLRSNDNSLNNDSIRKESSYFTIKLGLSGYIPEWSQPATNTNNPKTTSETDQTSDSEVKNYDNNNDDLKTIYAWSDMKTWNENIQNDYEPIFTPGDKGKNILKIMGTLGIQLKNRYLYRNVWVDTQPMEFTISMIFFADNDAYYDVVLPIRILQRCFTCDELGSLFLAPPNGGILDFKGVGDIDNILEKTKSEKGYAITKIEWIKIGEFISLKNILTKNINVEWDLINVDENGNPLIGRVSITLMSTSLWVTDTIDNLLKNKTDGAEEFNIKNIMKGVKKSLSGYGNIAVDWFNNLGGR